LISPLPSRRECQIWRSRLAFRPSQ
jgi:hypothetical protein